MRVLELTPIAGCCGRFLLVFIGLMAPWPGVADGYAAAFRWASQTAFSTIGSHRSVRFLDLRAIQPGDLPPGVAAPPATDVLDTLVVLQSRDDPSQLALMRTGSWQLGYRPTAFLIALVLATPIPWRRRGRCLVLGLAGVTLFVALRVFLTLAMGFSGDGPIALLPLGPTARGALRFVANFVALEFEGDLVLPAVIWFAVTFRALDVPGWMRSASAVASETHHSAGPPARPGADPSS